MKKIIILIIAAIITFCVAWWGINFFLSYKNVFFNLEGSEYILQIRDENGKKIKEINSSGESKLQEGSYFYNIVGEGYDSKMIPFTVKDEVKVTVKPQYLESYLSDLAKKEQAVIKNILTEKYPSIRDVSIQSMSIDKTGTWAYGKLTLPNSSTDVYRFIMKRTKTASWEVVVKPTIAISKSIVNDIPEEIIYSLY